MQPLIKFIPTIFEYLTLNSFRFPRLSWALVDGVEGHGPLILIQMVVLVIANIRRHLYMLLIYALRAVIIKTAERAVVDA